MADATATIRYTAKTWGVGGAWLGLAMVQLTPDADSPSGLVPVRMWALGLLGFVFSSDGVTAPWGKR